MNSKLLDLYVYLTHVCFPRAKKRIQLFTESAFNNLWPVSPIASSQMIAAAASRLLSARSGVDVHRSRAQDALTVTTPCIHMKLESVDTRFADLNSARELSTNKSQRHRLRMCLRTSGDSFGIGVERMELDVFGGDVDLVPLLEPSFYTPGPGRSDLVLLEKPSEVDRRPGHSDRRLPDLVGRDRSVTLDEAGREP